MKRRRGLAWSVEEDRSGKICRYSHSMGTLPTYQVTAHGALNTSAEQPKLSLQTQEAHSAIFCCITQTVFDRKSLKMKNIQG